MEEPSRPFGARVRGQAGVCKYLLNCDCGREISYSEDILREVVVRGLVDSKIQLDLLSDTKQTWPWRKCSSLWKRKKLGRDQPITYLNHKGERVTQVSTNETNARALKI